MKMLAAVFVIGPLMLIGGLPAAADQSIKGRKESNDPPTGLRCDRTGNRIRPFVPLAVLLLTSTDRPSNLFQ